jgi:hypothetical protein
MLSWHEWVLFLIFISQETYIHDKEQPVSKITTVYLENDMGNINALCS